MSRKDEGKVNKKHVTARLEETLVKDAKEFARKDRRSFSSVLEICLERCLPSIIKEAGYAS